jgi:hypothetical protein
LIPNASFIGHVSGIVIGYVIGFHLLDWFTDYLFICALLWTIIWMAWSLKKTNALPLSCCQMGPADAAGTPLRSVRIVQG